MVVSAAFESASREDLLALIGLAQRSEESYKGRLVEALAANEALLSANEQLVAANRQLAARVTELERRLNRNSGNSSLAPSSDAFGRPKPEPETQGGSGRRAKRPRGRQRGAKGSGLALVEDPDVVRDEFPQECGNCGAGFADLTAADSLGYSRRQCTDIPPTSAVVTETRWHTVACSCGCATSAPVPDEVPDAPCYGPNLAAFAAYLLVFQHVPVERAAELIADLTGAKLSTGWVAAQLPKAAGLIAGSLKLIKALLTLGHLLHADETTTNIAGRRRYLHVACTPALTFLALAPRSRAGVNALGILPGFRGRMVHDAYFQLYDGYPNARHQLCVAHVIRELTAQDQLYPKEKWADQIRWALARLIEQADRARADGLDHIPPDHAGVYLRAYRQGIAVGLSHHPRTSANAAQSDAVNLLERLRDRTDQYLRFTRDLHVPPTNNLGERDQRPVKTQVKISGCHQSEHGARTWLEVRSYISSARKNGVNAFEALRLAYTGTPWMPNIALEG